MFKSLLFLTFLFLQISVFGQIGYGFHASTDLYSYWNNPDLDVDKRSAGSALLNIGVGPKLWLGGENFTVSAQATAVIAPFAFNVKQFNGLGAAYFPMIMKLNFGGLSGGNKSGKLGFGIGGGVQYNKTELFGVTSEADALGVTRSNFRTYIAEASVGYGLSGFNLQFYLRYGWDPGTKANTFNLGIGYDFNLPKLKELTDPEF